MVQEFIKCRDASENITISDLPESVCVIKNWKDKGHKLCIVLVICMSSTLTLTKLIESRILQIMLRLLRTTFYQTFTCLG